MRNTAGITAWRLGSADHSRFGQHRSEIRLRPGVAGGCRKDAENRMLSDIQVDRVYPACGSTDIRKSIDGLAAIVQAGFHLDPFASALFVFCNRQQNKLKILYWETNGFWLYYRRLERGTFRWPTDASAGARHINRRQLRWLLDGLSLEQQQAHPEVTARRVI